MCFFASGLFLHRNIRLPMIISVLHYKIALRLQHAWLQPAAAENAFSWMCVLTNSNKKLFHLGWDVVMWLNIKSNDGVVRTANCADNNGDDVAQWRGLWVMRRDSEGDVRSVFEG